MARTIASLAGFGIHPATGGEIEEARAFATRLIGEKIVSAKALARVHAINGASLFIAREQGEITGILAYVMLNRAGLAAVRVDGFDGVEPAETHIARAFEEPAAVYGWGIAVSTRETGQRVIGAARHMGRWAVPHLDYYARPATEAGDRFMYQKLGFSDWPGTTSGLVWLNPLFEREPGWETAWRADLAEEQAA